MTTVWRLLKHSNSQSDEKIILGVSIDHFLGSYNISVINLSDNKAYLLNDSKSSINLKLSRLGFTDIDDSGLRFFLEQLGTSLNAINSETLQIDANSINFVLDLSDLKWSVQLTLDSSGQTFTDILQYQFKIIDNLKFSLESLKDLVKYKDHYARYKKTQDPSETNQEILNKYMQRNKHLNIDFSLLESFDESKWNAKYPQRLEDQIIETSLQMMNSLVTNDKPLVSDAPEPKETKVKRKLSPKKKRQGLIKRQVHKP